MKFEMRSNAGRTSRPPREEDRLQEASPSLTVWFDGGCPLCRREILLIKKLDRRRAIHFEDVDRADAVCPLDRAELLSRFHAQELGHPVVSGAAADLPPVFRTKSCLRDGLLGRGSHAQGAVYG